MRRHIEEHIKVRSIFALSASYLTTSKLTLGPISGTVVDSIMKYDMLLFHGVMTLSP
jgi:hypothetical protein